MTLQSKQDKRAEDLKTLSIAISTQSRLTAEAAQCTHITLFQKNLNQRMSAPPPPYSGTQPTSQFQVFTPQDRID